MVFSPWKRRNRTDRVRVEGHMRLLTTATAAGAVLAGFIGSMATAQAMTTVEPAGGAAPTADHAVDPKPVRDLLGPAPMPRPLPDLLPGLPSVGTQGKTELSVVFRAEDKAALRRATLTCDPAGGNHPNADEACQALDAAASGDRDPFAPVPPDQACTFIYGGPKKATVNGTWRDEPVKATFSRTNGCEVARWDALKPLLDLGSAG